MKAHALNTAFFTCLIISTNCYPQAIPNTTPQAVSFYMSSEGKGWAIEGTFQAEYRIYKDFIEVNLPKTRLKIPNTVKGKKVLTAMTAGLGYESPDKQWTIKNESLTIQFDKTIEENELFEPTNIKFLIPTNQDLDISKSWLVIRMVIKEIAPSAPEGYVYVHSGKDVFNLNKIKK